MTENGCLEKQINVVVDARGEVQEASEQRTIAYQAWVEANQSLLDHERIAKDACQEAETKLRELAIHVYAENGEKVVAPGVGIRVMTELDYEGGEAMNWAMEHKLALKLDASAFEKIAKTNNLPFVTISEKPQATIATKLAKIE